MATIAFKNVIKRYDDVTVIPKLNLEIYDKEFLVLVGPSGCGKSTTLRMIAGLEDVSEGELYIGDKCVNDIPPKDRDIAMVFQSYALYPHMTVYKNMAFGLKLRNISKDEIDKKVKSAAKALDIEQYLNRKPRALSGGQRQRVALGRAMVREPSVFLLDEPLSNLDAKLRTQMRSKISELHKQLQTTFVYVTHDQTEAMTMGDRIVVMKDGLIQQIDTPQNLYNYPCNMFVAGFIGSPQMNFIDAKLKLENNKIYAIFEGNKIFVDINNDLSLYDNRDVIVGIRPENIHAENSYLEKYNENKINLFVNLREMMGSEIFVHSTINGKKVIAKVPSAIDVPIDDNIEVVFKPNKIHIFDKDTKMSILS